MDSLATQFKILIDTTDKKITALNEILNISFNQELLLEQKMFNLPEYGEMLDEKKSRIDLVNDLDQTFVSIYEKVNIAIQKALPPYRDLIRQLQKKVFTASDLEVKIKIQEQKNQLLAQGNGLVKPRNRVISTSNALQSYQKQKK